MGDRVSAYTTKMEETDAWFEEKTVTVENLDNQVVFGLIICYLLFVYLLFVYLFICLFVYLFICLFVCLFIC